MSRPIPKHKPKCNFERWPPPRIPPPKPKCNFERLPPPPPPPKRILKEGTTNHHFNGRNGNGYQPISHQVTYKMKETTLGIEECKTSAFEKTLVACLGGAIVIVPLGLVVMKLVVDA